MAVKKVVKNQWRARVQVRTSRIGKTGKPIYKATEATFETKGAAEKWEKSQKQQHRITGSDGTLTNIEIAEYREAKKAARGRNLREVSSDWAKRNPEEKPRQVAFVVDAFQSSKEWANFADTTKSKYKSGLKSLSEQFGGHSIGDVTLEDLENYLDAIPCSVTRNTQTRLIKRFFKWATNRKHRFLSQNIAYPLEIEPEDSKSPEYLPITQIKALFDQAIKMDTAMIPFLALSFFAGIRSYELLRIEKRDFHIKERTINIRKEVAKPKGKGKPLPRFLEGLPLTVWQWLDAVNFDGEVDTANYTKRRRDLYQKAKIEHWPNSAARHSFSTYAYAYFEESGRVKKWTGHRGTDTVFLNHYAGLETKENGGKFFEILPPKTIRPIRIMHKNANRGNWPSDTELVKRLKSGEAKTKIAAEAGVSEAALRNRIRRRGLTSDSGSG